MYDKTVAFTDGGLSKLFVAFAGNCVIITKRLCSSNKEHFFKKGGIVSMDALFQPVANLKGIGTRAGGGSGKACGDAHSLMICCCQCATGVIWTTASLSLLARLREPCDSGADRAQACPQFIRKGMTIFKGK